ncbi:hypothetical protein D3C71_912150 [compost metagenome]
MKVNNEVVNKPALALLALIAWAALALQFWLSTRLAIANGGTVVDGAIAYFGYFTVLSNLFVALAATLPLVAGDTRLGRFFARPMVLGCATTSIVMVGIGYHLLLRNVWNPQGLQLLADNLLHYAVPISTLVYWLVFTPRTTFSTLAPLVWCIYPLGYLVYVFARGGLLGAYPYHFIDVASIGYPQVLLNSLGLFFAFLVVGAAVRIVPTLRDRLRTRTD